MSVQQILDAIRRREPWMANAACTNHPPELWFPTRGQPTTTAKAICNTCPVRTPCLHYGINEHHGIWGGLSEQQRDTYRKAHPMTTTNRDPRASNGTIAP